MPHKSPKPGRRLSGAARKGQGRGSREAHFVSDDGSSDGPAAVPIETMPRTSGGRGARDGNAARDLALHMALYRSAIPARAHGFTLFHIINMRITDIQQSQGGSFGNQEVLLKAKRTNDPALPLVCERRSSDRLAANCSIMTASMILASAGPLLNQTPEMAEAEVAAARRGLESH
jgi:hypothetical protein